MQAETAGLNSYTLDTPAEIISNFPPRLVCAASHAPGTGLTVSMGTLSWFWVPVISHALHIPGIPPLPTDHSLYQRGALFSLTMLVHIVRQLIQNGSFILAGDEVQPGQGGSVYFTASAQDRLNNLLFAHALNSPINQMANHISNWFDHLYAENIRQMMWQPGGQSANSVLAHAYHWGPHVVLFPNGQVITVPGSHVLGAAPMIPVWFNR